MATVYGELQTAVNNLNDLTGADISTALETYDGVKRSEATTDKEATIAEVDANETKIDTITAKTDNLPADTDATLTALSAQRIKLSATTEDLNQAAGSYTLFTGTTLDVILLGITLRNASVDCSDDAGGFTGISIQTDDATPAVFLSQANGVKANITSEATISWDGGSAGIYIKVGTIITLTIYGAAADATCAPDIVAVYRSTGDGTGTLAV